VSYAVNAPIDRDQRPLPDPLGDLVGRDPGGEQLGTGNHPVCPTGNSGDDLIDGADLLVHDTNNPGLPCGAPRTRLPTQPGRRWRRGAAGGSPPGSVSRRVPYTPAPMIKPRVDKLLDQTDSHYAAVLVVAKRARQLNSYYRALGEGSYEEFTPPMVETGTGNYLTISLEELAQGKLKYEYRA
jgi:DNA-directed RNA polymerase subunit omega